MAKNASEFPKRKSKMSAPKGILFSAVFTALLWALGFSEFSVSSCILFFVSIALFFGMFLGKIFLEAVAFAACSVAEILSLVEELQNPLLASSPGLSVLYATSVALSALSFLIISALLFIEISKKYDVLERLTPYAMAIFYVIAVLYVTCRSIYVFRAEEILNAVFLMFPVIGKFSFFHRCVRWVREPFIQPTPSSHYLDDIALKPTLTLFLLPILAIPTRIWRYTRYTNLLDGERKRIPLVQLLLCLLVPFYVLVWLGKTSARVDRLSSALGVQSRLARSSWILFLLCPPLPFLLIQFKINKNYNAEAKAYLEEAKKQTEASSEATASV